MKIITILALTAVSFLSKRIPTAAEYLGNSLKEYDKSLYVYKDFADGANYYTQKSWMGDGFDNVPRMREDFAGYKGVTGIACEIDFTEHSWGGYMFINGVLPAGTTEPIHDYGERDAALDLTGASKLVFYAKGETGGERVEFLMGGLGSDGYLTAPFADSAKSSLGYVQLSKTWKRFEIPLDGADLSRVGCGFAWVANNLMNPLADNILFYVDEIRYEFPEKRVEPMFLRSYEPAAPGTDESIINNFAYLYDQCAAAMALSYAGNGERARQIADAIVYALNNDRYFTDFRLRNAYANGSPQSYPGWFSGKVSEFARLPGYSDPAAGVWYEDYYSVSTSAGNLAWCVLSLCEVYENAGKDMKYLTAAEKVGEFILTLHDERGGFTAGYEGWEGSQIKATYKSVEHNIDLIAAFGRLSKLTGKAEYAAAAAHAKNFVLSMYDAEKSCFYTGTTNDGVTVNKEVIPLDCQTWAILALGDEFKNSAETLRFVEESMAVGSGYDFNGYDKDGVWFEGTAQTALAYLFTGDAEKYREILDYLNGNRRKDGSIAAADRDFVSTGFLVSGTDIPWNYGARGHVGASAWLAFAQMGKNPFAY
jgi:hypothetical protein